MKNIRNIIESKYPPVNNEDLWLKDGKLYHSTSQGWVPLSEEPSITETYEQGVSSISYSGKDGQEHQIELSENVESDVTNIINDTFVTDEDNNVTFTDDNDTEHTLVTTDSFPSILANNSMLEVTWLLLKDMRDNKQLIAGSLYRITDYNCTTTQENTQSAGHQFDIILLALSANKLAEEGWAMMHDNIYDVTFSDGVTKKCYVYQLNDDEVNVVDCETLLGVTEQPSDVIINGNTATVDDLSDQLVDDDLPYNYFQNSNLSAWKVWYCLDNDTARFAWADDSVDEGSPASIVDSLLGRTFIRDFSQDNPTYGDYFGWTSENLPLWTATETPSIGDSVYGVDRQGNFSAIGTVTSSTPAQEGTGLPNGRGVIYRLIDEWNNDVPYDFKNILYLRNVDDATITTDNSGTDMYIPTFCLKDDSTGEYKDASIFAVDYSISNISTPCSNNKIGKVLVETGQFMLNDIVIISYVANDDNIWDCNYLDIKMGLNLSFNACNRIDVLQCQDCVISDSQLLYIMYSNDVNLSQVGGIIRDTKKVVWENIS